MYIIAQQSGWRVARNCKLIPVKCIWKTFCVGKLNTARSVHKRKWHIHTFVHSCRTDHHANCVTLGGGKMHFPFCSPASWWFGARNVSALCQDSSVYAVLPSCPCGILGWGNMKQYLTPQPIHQAPSIQFHGGMHWHWPLITRSFPFFNFQENKSFANSMTLKIVNTDMSMYWNPSSVPSCLHGHRHRATTSSTSVLNHAQTWVSEEKLAVYEIHHGCEAWHGHCLCLQSLKVRKGVGKGICVLLQRHNWGQYCNIQ